MIPARLLTLLLLATAPALAYDPATGAIDSGRYTFSWPLGEDTLKPRGATTRGAPVTLETGPSEEWRRLAEPGLSPQERDRRAILAMAGGYRVTFDFLEVVRFQPGAAPDAPYQSWGTEYVFVGEDKPGFIALQHILVMRVVQKDGTESAPFVMRHWRQEWRYEADRLLAYEGGNAWAVREVPPAERHGAWVQSVYQVDDSPRYAARGRWQHADGYSTWISDETWRPLPRREWSVRKDYQVLVGTNRHTITPGGWVQEENNLKVALDAPGKPREKDPYLAREYGVARYERIRDYDFGPGRDYFEKTEPFWAEVRAAWSKLGQSGGQIALRQQADQGQLFMPFFEYAERLADGAAFDRDDARAFIEKTLQETYLRG